MECSQYIVRYRVQDKRGSARVGVLVSGWIGRLNMRATRTGIACVAGLSHGIVL